MKVTQEALRAATQKTLRSAAKKTTARAEKMLGRGTTQDLLEAADETLVKLGHDAARRQRRRAVRHSLTTVAKAAAVVGVGAAAVLVARNARRGRS